MRRHLASLTAVLAAAAASFLVTPGTVLAAGSPSAGAAPAGAGTAGTAATTAATSAPKNGTPKSSTPTATTTPTTAVKAAVGLVMADAFIVHHDVVTVPGRVLQVKGFVRPYVAGQWVEVRSSVGKRVFKTDRLRVKPSASRTYGVFIEKIKSPRAGIVRVQVTHKRTPQMLGFEGRRGVAALGTTGPGSRGKFVDLIQRQLVALHFYLPLSGVYDLQTRLAVDAYHRLLGGGTSQTLDPATVADLLDGRGAFTVRDPRDGKHVEGDLGNQLLALIIGSKVDRIYPISSGKPSTPTVLGRFQVYSRVPGYLPDGMYFSDFFYRGYAIHGYDPAPDYAASHGCMRLPISDALSVWNWLTYGVTVDVYQ